MKEEANVAGFAEDYAFVIQGLLDLYETDFDVTWLQFAIELAGKRRTDFFSTTRTVVTSAQAATTKACCCG